MKKIFVQLREVESRIESTEQLIENLNGNVDVRESKESFQ
jgi:hypothetical protein